MRLLFFCFILFSIPASAHPKFAIFDMELAVQSTSDGKRAKTKLMKEFKSIEDRLKKRELNLKDKFKAFEKKALILSEKKRQEQQQELQKISFELQKDLQRIQMEFQRKQLAAAQPIIEKIKKHLSAIAREKGYQVILNKGVNNVLWSEQGVDITSKVIKRYEQAKKAS